MADNIEKVKISDESIPVRQTLDGFFALGVNAQNENCKADLGLIRAGVEQIIIDTDAAKDAANNAAAAANQTNAAVQVAEAARVNAENDRVIAETARDDAETAREEAETVRDDAETAREEAIGELVSKGDYDDQAAYKKNNMVLYSDGCGYIAVQDAVAGILPTDAAYWKKIAEKGTSYHPYTAWASDNQGSDFSLNPSPNLKFRADIQSTVELDPPVAADFAGADWIQFIYHTDNSYDLPLIGDLDGVNDTFDLPRAFVPGTAIIWDGSMRLKRGVHFNDDTGQIVFTAGNIPQPDAELTADVVTDENTIIGETPVGVIDGVNKVFTLSRIPIESTTCGFNNGVKQKRGVHYTLVNDQITFDDDWIPQPGDILDFDFKY